MWTREKVLEGLTIAMFEISGQLPCSADSYNPLKKDRFDWPPAARVWEFFKALGHGWLAAGADPGRVSLHNASWTDQETEYLLEWAGKKTLARIAKDLGRSYQATRLRMGSKGNRITARGNQGLLSAAELAKEYGTSYQRVRNLLRTGVLPGRYDHIRNRWQSNPVEFTPAMIDRLTAPRGTYKTWAVDFGNYPQRYGLYRTKLNGKTVYVKDQGLV